MAVKGDIEIKEQYCVGCGYCAWTCQKGCILMPGDKFNAQGYPLPLFTNTDKCTGCAACAFLCPRIAIDVFRHVGREELGGLVEDGDGRNRKSKGGL